MSCVLQNCDDTHLRLPVRPPDGAHARVRLCGRQTVRGGAACDLGRPLREALEDLGSALVCVWWWPRVSEKLLTPAFSALTWTCDTQWSTFFVFLVANWNN